VSRNRAKGTAAESAVVRFFQTVGWPHAERRALSGSKDRGDVTGVPGICVEVKSAVRLEIPAWLRETEAERINAAADYGVLIIKPKSIGDTRVGQWAAVMPLGDLTRLLAAAGYGDGLPEQESA
jgi:Holliday junction resolvase